jgi:hypothetical protein
MPEQGSTQPMGSPLVSNPHAPDAASLPTTALAVWGIGAVAEWTDAELRVYFLVKSDKGIHARDRASSRERSRGNVFGFGSWRPPQAEEGFAPSATSFLERAVAVAWLVRSRGHFPLSVVRNDQGSMPCEGHGAQGGVQLAIRPRQKAPGKRPEQMADRRFKLLLRSSPGRQT